MSQRIEDYAVLGDLHTAAIVGLDGSIDWLCLPHFDSPSCFSRLLGDESHGFWQIAPSGGPANIVATRRKYRDNSLVLETEFDTATGTVRITDCMPMRDSHPHVVRLVEGISGTVDMHMCLTVRFDYGEIVPWVTSTDGLIRMTAGPDAVALWHLVDPIGKDLSTEADFTVREGQRFPFTFVWFASHEEPPPPLDAYYAINLTDAYWKEWADQCTYEGPYREAVVRSLITLKALTYEPTGGIVAAATTSLPEAVGGSRNWDYRYCWLRDATLTLESLMRGGYYDEAMAWRDWLLRAVAGDVSRLQIMYGPAGERRLDEWEASWLPGYENSAPVRIGNAASGQYQLDVYGEVMSALYASAHADGVQSKAAWALQTQLVDFLKKGWREPDDGIWEVRGPRRHFTHSKVMAWVAVDRAVKTLEAWPDLEGPLEEWRTLRHEIFTEVCEKGYNAAVGAFTQYYGCDQLDASALMIPLVGFLPPSDPRVVSTIDAVQKGLVDNGFVLRYRTADDGAVDGLTGREGAFLACSFWLVDCLHMIGRTKDADALFRRLLALRNDLGLLSEEYDAVDGRLVGNFPQAFSHVSLVNSACRLTGRDALAIDVPEASRRRRIVDHTLTMIPSMPKPPRRKRAPRVARERGGISAEVLQDDATHEPEEGPPSMKALTVIPLKAGSAELSDIDEPPESDGPVLVETLAIGICGTDIEILSGAYGWSPPGRERLVLGHESLGRVLEAPAGAPVSKGDLVVGIVRRPDPVPCENCAVLEWDFCRNGLYTERGIKERDGYLSERYRIESDFVIKIDPALGILGVLLEPTSVVAKAWEEVDRVGSRAHWDPKTVLITGAGPIGLLAALIGVQRGLDVHVLDQMTTGVKPDLVHDLGATYHTGAVADALPDPDVIIECTGVSSLVLDAMSHVGIGGVVCLTGVSSGGHTIAVDEGALNRSMVLENVAVVGSVNANKRHYEAAAAALAKADRSWLDRVVSRKVPLKQWQQAIDRQPDDVKVIIEVNPA